jgi:hypothetical protein
MHSKPNRKKLYGWAYSANTYFEHAMKEESVALRRYFYAVGTNAFAIGIGMLHTMKAKNEDVEFYMSQFHYLPKEEMKVNGFRNRLVLFAVLRFPFVYFRLRRWGYLMARNG